jgi:TonB-linked SusC/RagA family outer membrane protein
MLTGILLTVSVFGQQIPVTGTVVDDNGESLPGVNVTIKGTTQGVVSDVNGKFSINVPNEEAVLQFTFVGYSPQEIVTGDRRTIDVTLSEAATELDEVVVVGYGTVRKRDLTGSVASVSGDDITAVPTANAAQALQGRLPGVNVVSQDGRPDATISIRVRGGGSISQSNDPLFIVDGFPVSSISDIPGDIIDRIDVLKDASSTAIYGARGANGVILITTKGAKGERVSVTYNGYYQYKQPSKYLESLNAYDYVAFNWAYSDMLGNAVRESWEKLWAIGPQAATYNNSQGIDYYKSAPAKNYSKEIFEPSNTYNHNLTVSGGSDKTKIMFSVNYLSDDGTGVNSYFNRANASFKLDQKIGEKLRFHFDTRYSQMNSVMDYGTRGSTAYRFRPIPVEYVKGEIDPTVNTGIGMFDDRIQEYLNPVALIKDYTPERTRRNLLGNASLSWDIVQGLTARSEVSVMTNWSKTMTWAGPVYNSSYTNADGTLLYSGDATIARSEGWNILWSNTLNYKVPLGKNHSLDVLGGYEVSNSGGESMSMWGKYFPVSYDAERAFAMMDQYGTDKVNPSALNHGFSSSADTPNRLLSFFGRANYSYLQRYLLTVTLRADGSSKFLKGQNWGYFPAAALGWRMSDESFMKDVQWIDNLKFRLSYGEVGNDNIPNNLGKMLYESTGTMTWSLGGKQQVGYRSANGTVLANPYLTWETTVTRNIGIDYGLFKNHLYGAVELYWNTTRDLLMRTDIASISGFSQTFDNVGKTSNKGVEISIGADLLRAKDYSLSINTNINFNRGNIDELAEGVQGLYNSGWGSSAQRPSFDYLFEVGNPVGLVRGYQYDGFYTTADFDYAGGKYTLKNGIPDLGPGLLGETDGSTSLKPSGQSAYPGAPKLKDVSGPSGTPDGIVDDYDCDIIGDTNPVHTGGFNISGRYKGWDLSMNFNWVYGNKVYNTNKAQAFQGNKGEGRYFNRLDYVQNAYSRYDIQNGQLVLITDPAALDALNVNADSYSATLENAIVSTYVLEDGSYLRLNTLTLGYSLPKQWIDKVKLQRARFYLTMTNVFTLTDYTGLDPEVNSNQFRGGSGFPTPGMDYGTYPRSRSYTVGVNLEF